MGSVSNQRLLVFLLRAARLSALVLASVLLSALFVRLIYATDVGSELAHRLAPDPFWAYLFARLHVVSDEQGSNVELVVFLIVCAVPAALIVMGGDALLRRIRRSKHDDNGPAGALL